MRKKLCLLLFLGLLLTSCSKFNETDDNLLNQSMSTETVENFESKDGISIEQVSFEVSTMTTFLPGSSFGVFSYNGKYGLINSNGEVAIKPTYEMLSAPSEDHLIAEHSDGSFSILKSNGSETGKINYKNGELEINRLLSIDDLTYRNGSGEFSEGLAFMSVMASDIKSVCVDTSGNIVFESNLELFGKYHNGVAIGRLVTDSNEINIVAIDKTGKELWRKTVQNFPMNCNVSFNIIDDIIVYQSVDSMWGAVDINGNEIVPCEFEELTYAGDGRIGFKEYGLWGYLDYDGNIVIEPKYTQALDFRGGVAFVTENNQDYFIDIDGNQLFEYQGTYVSYFDSGVIIGDMSKIMDINGNILYEVDISENGVGGTRNGISYQGGEIIYSYMRGIAESVESYTFYKIV